MTQHRTFNLIGAALVVALFVSIQHLDEVTDAVNTRNSVQDARFAAVKARREELALQCVLVEIDRDEADAGGYVIGQAAQRIQSFSILLINVDIPGCSLTMLSPVITDRIGWGVFINFPFPIPNFVHGALNGDMF